MTHYYNIIVSGICGILLYDNYKQYNTIKTLENKLKRFEIFYDSKYYYTKK
jgi:hypothetical protein